MRSQVAGRRSQDLGLTSGDQAVEHPVDLIDPRCVGRRRNEPTSRGSTNPVLGFERRAASHEEKATLVGLVPSPQRLGDVGADRVGRPNQLNPERPTIEGLPGDDDLAQIVREDDRLPIDDQICEAATHVLKQTGRLGVRPCDLRPATCGLEPS